MKSLILSVAAAATLLIAAPALADNDHHHHGGGGNPGHSQHGSFNGGGHQNRSVQRIPRVHENRVHENRNATVRNNTFRAERRTRNVQHNVRIDRHVSNSHVTVNSNRNDRNRNYRSNYRNNDRSTYRSSGRNNSRVVLRANFRRHNVSASHHYHYRSGAYRGPSGYHYRRWSYGERLPSLYFARDYWIDDFSDYGLGYPPEGCVWVRYGADAILIDEDTGEILEVVYGQFY